MDWSWVYGTLIREAGWTFEQCWDQPACNVFEFLEHLRAYPSADTLMRLRYGIKPPQRKTTAKSRAKKASEQNLAEMREMQTYLGAAQPLTPHLRSLVDWANAQDDRMSAPHPKK